MGYSLQCLIKYNYYWLSTYANSVVIEHWSHMINNDLVFPSYQKTVKEQFNQINQIATTISIITFNIYTIFFFLYCNSIFRIWVHEYKVHRVRVIQVEKIQVKKATNI